MDGTTGKLTAFAYLNAENAELYMCIMRAFAEARERFVLHLRPPDVARAVTAAGLDPGAVEAALRQLAEWGNLRAHPDTAAVATVEDFYRQRFLYQLTPEGEAALSAVAAYFEALARRGELQAAALGDIRTMLEGLLRMLVEPELDDAAVHLLLTGLRSRFEELTAQAQAFMGSLQRAIDLHGAEVSAFLAYKQRLIEYLERFIGELVVATADIAGLLGRIDGGAARRLSESAGRREAADALGGTEDGGLAVAAAAGHWRARLEGLRGWFIGQGGMPSQAEELRARARAAIPALLAAIATLHDRRVSRSDRATDWRTLARWFAEAEGDGEAHALWRAAFALAPARHLFIDEDALAAREAAPVAASTSWLDAPPIAISPRLRATGRYSRPGRPSGVIDRSREKAVLAAQREEEERRLRAAQGRLATGRPTRLSELGELADDAFELFLDLLGEALAAGETETTSSDGLFAIALTPTGDGRIATIHTPSGTFRGPDHTFTIRMTIPDHHSREAHPRGGEGA